MFFTKKVTTGSLIKEYSFVLLMAKKSSKFLNAGHSAKQKLFCLLSNTPRIPYKVLFTDIFLTKVVDVPFSFMVYS